MTKEEIRRIAEDRFSDIVQEILEPSPEKVRFLLHDRSFVDIRISQKAKNRFDFSRFNPLSFVRVIKIISPLRTSGQKR